MLSVHLEQVILQKRFLMYRISSVYQAASENRSEEVHEVNYMMTGNVNFLPFQEMEINNSLCLVVPECEP